MITITDGRRRADLNTEAVMHVVLHCPALAAEVWPILWPV